MGLFKIKKKNEDEKVKESETNDAATQWRLKIMATQVVGYYGENDPFDRPKEWFTSEQGQKAMAYYRAQFNIPMYYRQITEMLGSTIGYVDDDIRRFESRDKWPTAYFYYYIKAVNPNFESYDKDLNFIVLCLMLNDERNLEPLLYFVEHFNPKAAEVCKNDRGRPYALSKIVSYICAGAREGIDTYKEEWIYDEKTYINKKTGTSFSQNEVLYAATLLVGQPNLFPDVKEFIDELISIEKSSVFDNLM